MANESTVTAFPSTASQKIAEIRTKLADAVDLVERSGVDVNEDVELTAQVQFLKDRLGLTLV